jgi:ketosteroid isomerase-like protein
VIVTMNARPDQPGEGVTLIGVQALNAHLATVAALWEELSYDVGALVDDGPRVRCQVRMAVRHRESGAVLDGSKRQIWTVRDGVVVALEGIFDSASVDAILRLPSQGKGSPASPSPSAPRFSA